MRISQNGRPSQNVLNLVVKNDYFGPSLIYSSHIYHILLRVSSLSFQFSVKEEFWVNTASSPGAGALCCLMSSLYDLTGLRSNRDMQKKNKKTPKNKGHRTLIDSGNFWTTLSMAVRLKKKQIDEIIFIVFCWNIPLPVLFDAKCTLAVTWAQIRQHVHTIFA